MSAITVQGSPAFLATTETINYFLDAKAWLGQGDVVSNPTSVLMDLYTNTATTLTYSPSASGTGVYQKIAGSTLIKDHRYSLRVTFDVNVNQTLTMELILIVV